MSSGRLATYQGGEKWLTRLGVIDNAPPPNAFVLGQTRPVPGDNVGPDPTLGTLDPYTGPNAGGVLTITSPVTYEGVDFGTTRVRVNSSNVLFNHCKWTNAQVCTETSNIGPMVDFRGGSNYTGRRMFRCEVGNVSQWAPSMSGVMGYGFVAERCYVHDCTDAFGTYVPSSRPDTAIDAEILGCWFGSLSFYAHPGGTNGVVHPSDDHTHNDAIQHQGGRGLKIIGCDISAFYSTTVGTGTPNSGSDTGGVNASAVPYTQAAGEALRYQFVEDAGAQSATQLGGSIAGLQFTNARGGVVAGEFRDNWGSGGARWLNAVPALSDPSLTYSFGIVTGNRVTRTQREPGVAIAIKTGVTAQVSGNTWQPDGATIARTNV